MKTVPAIAILFLAVGFNANALVAADKPNVLILLSDDHSYPYLSCYGSPNVHTPTLDKLARDGMRFHRYFTAAPQCVPARASLMTGRSPVAARMTRFSAPLPRDELSLPELLRDQAGYHTGICGRSFHLDGSGNRGGEEIAALLTKHKLRTFEERVHFLKNGADRLVPTLVEQFLESCPPSKPFFMWANFSDPHHVWDAATELRPKPNTLVLPEHLPDLPGVREQLADYCAEVNRLDQSVAKVLEVLVKRGLMENTIIVFAGDNGGALPHGKGSLYDPGSNTPLIVRWPGVIASNSESRALISGEDIAPTLLDAAGVKPIANMTGQSFLPLLQGKPSSPRKYLFVERGPHGSAPVQVNMKNSGYDLSRSVRSDRYKFIYNCTPWIPYAPVDSAGGQAWKDMVAANEVGNLSSQMKTTYFTTPRQVYELYDLEQDPAELNNLSGSKSMTSIERELRLALAEKMIVDWDYLPLPAIPSAD